MESGGSFPPYLYLTGDFIADEFAALDVADAAEEAANLLLGHGLRQVVDDEVRLGLLRLTLLAAGTAGRRLGVGRRGSVHAAIAGQAVQAPRRSSSM